MNLKEIVNRPNEAPIQQHEAYFVIKEYVKARKGVDINPTIDTRLGVFSANMEIKLMHKLLDYAIAWFRENPTKI